ncbi:exodeoxyribonuclease VII small subunit [Parenemella sanctibonifatiensis]|uniref:Exodeoxyribonuclease 7 small subunit n=1 Tax=Parenemella sanctibonifatiensis TaxID=2016505 RepID=A0A255EVV0_9ACTN|nr:exodeoxyribonuclease VII small subunit [Parenemella sanctibonifatiensis]OYN87961.1 exodeoxyribonuclease VII small subunit [Parenemella sanctibonifatiensis]OYN92263.1 exodeoxyribonuclease VII small subunit [Parenemella sanctibonifatiensis]
MSEELSYEQARDALVDVVQKLESGGVPLADSMELWQRGEKLAAICESHLAGARRTVEQGRAAREADETD